MRYLTVPPARENWPRFAEAGIGIMRTPASGDARDCVGAFPVWAADNGCYTQGDAFDLDAYLAWLEVMRLEAGHCLFATAPDVVGDASSTWERSRDVLPQIRALGYRAALVAQNGIQQTVIEWASFDCLFIGGTDDWKLDPSIHELVIDARARGKWVHIGRVNSWRRLARFLLAGADSADGSTVAFNTARYVPEVLRWAHRLKMQQRLWMEDVA